MFSMRERDRDRDRDRQTERETERGKEGGREKESEGERERETDRQRDREREGGREATKGKVCMRYMIHHNTCTKIYGESPDLILWHRDYRYAGIGFPSTSLSPISFGARIRRVRVRVRIKF